MCRICTRWLCFLPALQGWWTKSTALHHHQYHCRHHHQILLKALGYVAFWRALSVWMFSWEYFLPPPLFPFLSLQIPVILMVWVVISPTILLSLHFPSPLSSCSFFTISSTFQASVSQSMALPPPASELSGQCVTGRFFPSAPMLIQSVDGGPWSFTF